MNLNLERPLVFFDIESTGLDIANDSIVELCFVKVYPDGSHQPQTWRVKPWDYEEGKQRPMNPNAEAIHGISDEDVAKEKTFYEIIDEVQVWLKDCDLAGFNSARFDLPMLAEEIERVRKADNDTKARNPQHKCKDIYIDLHQAKMIDVQTIYHTMEPRNLKAAYRFYCGKDLENAHSAEADTLATYEVLKGELDRYPEGQENSIKNNVEWLSNFSTRQKFLDYAGCLYYGENNEVTISFGKHKGQTARKVFKEHPEYFSWIETSNFTLDTKMQFRKLKEEFTVEMKLQRINKDNCPRTKGNTPMEGLGDLWSQKD